MNFGNYVKTGLLMAAIVALFGAVGAALGGAQGMLLALAFGVATNFAAYWFSDKLHAYGLFFDNGKAKWEKIEVSSTYWAAGVN